MSKREREQEKEGAGRKGGEREPWGRKKGEEGEGKNEKGPNRWRQKLTEVIGWDQRDKQREDRRKQKGRGKLWGLRILCCLQGGTILPHTRLGHLPPPPPPPPKYQVEINGGGIWCKYSSFRTEPLMYSKKLFSCGLLCMLLISLLQILLFSEVPGDPLTTDFYGKEVG